MTCELAAKCAILIALVHLLRTVGRRIGPRASGLLLGLPSSSALLLVLCTWERGPSVALAIADASLLGLIASVALPVAYLESSRRRLGPGGSMAMSVGAYIAVAVSLGFFDPGGLMVRLSFSVASILGASWLASRVEVPAGGDRRVAGSPGSMALFRTAVPMVFMACVGVITSAVHPRIAGLFSTFPSLSAVVIAVTHLEEGPARAGRVARVLPSANLSTAAFLGTFRLACPILGLGWGTLASYAAALVVLGCVDFTGRLLRDRSCLVPAVARRIRWEQADGPRPRLGSLRPPRSHAARGVPTARRLGVASRRAFAPRIERLAF